MQSVIPGTKGTLATYSCRHATSACPQPAAAAGRTVETDHGAFVLLNCYVPNAGGAREGRPRAHFKLRFLQVPQPGPRSPAQGGQHAF